jgi:hypothetical protein
VIAARFEDVIVQKEPSAPVHCEHSFVTWRSPFRAEGTDAEAAPVLSERARAAKPATSTKAKIVVVTLNLIVVSFPSVELEPNGSSISLPGESTMDQIAPAAHWRLHEFSLSKRLAINPLCNLEVLERS